MTIKQELFRDILEDTTVECMFMISSRERTILNSLMTKIKKPEKNLPDTTKLKMNGLLKETKNKLVKNLRI